MTKILWIKDVCHINKMHKYCKWTFHCLVSSDFLDKWCTGLRKATISSAHNAENILYNKLKYTQLWISLLLLYSMYKVLLTIYFPIRRWNTVKQESIHTHAAFKASSLTSHSFTSVTNRTLVERNKRFLAKQCYIKAKGEHWKVWIFNGCGILEVNDFQLGMASEKI